MEKIFDLVPKDKFDVSGIEKLRRIGIEEAEPILGSLLEWVQDLNWPVAQELIKVLPRFHRQLIPHIDCLDRDYPPNSLPWSNNEEKEQFRIDAQNDYARWVKELGYEYDINE